MSLTETGAEVISTIIETRSRVVNNAQAVDALSSLAQDHRLSIFRLLVQAGAAGMPAGAIAEALDLPNSSLSFHLAHLRRAGLINQARRSRSIIYSANYGAMNALVGFLMENCCAGAACTSEAICAPDAAPTPAKRKSA
jgi:DNA-binding transcriptional ArsR family regulator